ncbi:MAG: ABC transporter substrate-binding protein [Gammaproteobacteria bacterium]
MIKRIQQLVTISILLLSSAVLAESNPQVIVQKATEQMMTELRDQRDAISEDKTIVNEIVERVLLPEIASNTIARKVMGKYARTATDEQKKRFAAAFKGYMIRFYSNAFAEYTDETVEYLEAPDFANERRVTIRTKLNLAAGEPVPINYVMQRSRDSWKIIDVVIEGISLVISNRTQFGNSISRDGLDTVIAKLEYKQTEQVSNE